MTPKHEPNLPWREVDGKIVVLSPKAGTIHELNPVGSFLWKNANGEASSRSLAEKLAEQYDVPLAEALIDVEGFFRELESLKLVQRNT